MTTRAAHGEPLPVYLEVGKKRVFACALDWPGWCRSGRTEDLALDSLHDYAGRYAPVVIEAGLDFPGSDPPVFRVVERLDGAAGTTDFGAPGAIAAGDRLALTPTDAYRLTRILKAAWTTLDRIAGTSPPILQKGPRGGGRDRDKLIDHVLGAETVYARKLGVRLRQPMLDDTHAIAAMREAIVETLVGVQSEAGGWPPRYAVRRIAWHVLDHAWEMEDRRGG